MLDGGTNNVKVHMDRFEKVQGSAETAYGSVLYPGHDVPIPFGNIAGPLSDG